METRRIVPLFDPASTPPGWNQRMHAGEYAVLFANRQPADIDPALGPVAVIFPTLADATRYAEAETAREPYLRCSLYTDAGLGAPPVAVIACAKGADKSFLSSKFRLWGGSIGLGVGMVLGSAELLSGMSLSWPGMLAARIGPAGALLLLTELGVRLSARHKQPA